MADNIVPVTVLMPVYNGEKFLKEAIESILGQSFENFEFLIINDGSTDNTENIILSYSDKRIRYIKNEQNIKLIATLNKGLHSATGKYIARMDADDISLPDRLYKQFHFMEENPEIGICGTWAGDPEGKSISKYKEKDEEIKFRMLYQCHFCHPSVMIRSSIIKENKLYYNPEFIHAEDYALWVKAMPITKFANIQENLFLHRNHSQSVSYTHNETQSKIADQIIAYQLNQLELPSGTKEINLIKNIGYCNLNQSPVEIKETETIIIKLIHSNKLKNIYPEPYFSNQLREIWYQICLNCKGLGRKEYVRLNKLTGGNLIPKRELKLLLKSVIK